MFIVVRTAPIIIKMLPKENFNLNYALISTKENKYTDYIIDSWIWLPGFK